MIVSTLKFVITFAPKLTMIRSLISAFSLMTSLTFVSPGGEDGIPTDGKGIYILTGDNFRQAIKKNEFIMVEFYSPYCIHCTRFAPEYAKVATLLDQQSLTVKLGKVNCNVEKGMIKQHQIMGYPTLKFYKNGYVVPYGGTRQAEDIVQWIKHQLSGHK